MASSAIPEIDVNNFIKFSKEKRDEFHRLNSAQLGEFLLDENLLVENEQEAFEALQQWVTHSPTDRLAEVPKLLPLIRLNQLDRTYLASTVNDFAIEGKCAPLVDAAIHRQNLRLDERGGFAVEFQTKPRKSATEVILCAFIHETIAKYSTKTKIWTKEEAEDMSEFDLRSAQCMRGKFEMIIYDRNEDIFHKLNLITLKTAALPPMLEEPELEMFTVEIVDDILYVLGVSGEDFQKFNFRSGEWSDMKPMPTLTSGHCSAVLNGKIYAAGGNPKSVVQCYDPITDDWALMPPMSVTRFNAQMIAFKDCLYLFGGADNDCNSSTSTKAIERFDPVANEWTTIANLKDYIYGFCTVSVLDRVFLLGGYEVTEPIRMLNKTMGECNKMLPWQVFDLNAGKFVDDLSSRRQPHFAWPCVGFYIQE